MNALFLALSHVAKVAWRLRWTFGVPIATFVLCAIVYSLRLPDVFTAKAIIKVAGTRADTVARVLPQQLEITAEKELVTARDRVLTLDNLSVLQPILGGGTEVASEATLDALRSRVEYDQIATAAFTLSITDVDPSLAARAVNRLTERFLETERQARLGRADRRRDFCDQEVERMAAEYKRIDTQLDAEKAKYADSLPEQKDSLVSQLIRLDGELREREAQASVGRRLVQEYERLALQLESGPKAAAVPPAGSDEEFYRLKVHGQEAALDAANRELSSATTRYTDKHPTVVQLKREVEELQGSLERAQAAMADAHRRAAHTTGTEAARPSVGPLQGLQMMKAAAVEERTVAEQDVQRLRPLADQVRARLGRIPVTEEALAPFKRDRESAARALESLRTQAEQARSAAEFYRRGDTPDVTGYGVEVWATIPTQPSGPKRSRFLLVALGVGVAVGYGLVLLRRKFEERVVLEPKDVVELLPQAAVVCVPVLGPTAPKWRAWIREGACGAYVVGCFCASVWLLAMHAHLTAQPAWVRVILGRG